MLLSSFITTTAARENLFDHRFTLLGLIFIVGGAYFLLKDDARY